MVVSLIAGIIGGAMGGFTLANMIPPMQRSLQYYFNSKYPNEILPIQAYIEGYYRGFKPKSEVYAYGKKLGLDEMEVDTLIRLYRKIPSIELIVTGLHRGFINLGDAKNYFKEMGYTDKEIDLILNVYKAYPSPSDFIRFAVRDVFKPDRVKKYELDKEFPEDIVPYAEKVGMDRDVLMWYWMAHWELPSPEMVMRMVNILQPDVLDTRLPDGSRYGDKYKDFGIDPDKIITTYDDMSEYLATADISPFWRDRMKALTFPPITRVDLRRLYQLGIISEEELYARLLELGYSKLDARRMVQFYKIYKISHERDLTKSEILTFYSERFIKYEEAKNYLMEIGYSEDEAEFLLTITDEKVTLEQLRYKIDALELQYVKGVIDEAQLREELAKLNLPADKIEYEIDKSRDRKLKFEKLPSKTELIKMAIGNLISLGEYIEYMKRQGYSEKWAEKLLRLYGG